MARVRLLGFAVGLVFNSKRVYATKTECSQVGKIQRQRLGKSQIEELRIGKRERTPRQLLPVVLMRKSRFEKIDRRRAVLPSLLAIRLTCMHKFLISLFLVLPGSQQISTAR